MSAATGLKETSPAVIPFGPLLEAMDGLGVRMKRTDAGGLALAGASGLSAELLDAVREHKTALLDLCAVRAECRLLSDRIVAMRCGDPPRGTRREGLDWVQRRINALAARHGVGGGYDDPSDPFAEDAFVMLQEELDEMNAFGAPYPVPLSEGCTLLPEANFDPFEHGRRYNWKAL